MIGLCLNKDAGDAVEEQSKVLNTLLHRLHTTKVQVCLQSRIAKQELESILCPACIMFKDEMNAHDSTVYVTLFESQEEAASIYWCLSRQHLFPQVLHQRAEGLAVAIQHDIHSSNECKIFRSILACLRQLFDQIPDFSAKADLWLPSLWRLILVQPKAPYTEVSIYGSWILVSLMSRNIFGL